MLKRKRIRRKKGKKRRGENGEEVIKSSAPKPNLFQNNAVLSRKDMLQLQGVVGNQAVQRMIESSAITPTEDGQSFISRLPRFLKKKGKKDLKEKGDKIIAKRDAKIAEIDEQIAAINEALAEIRTGEQQKNKYGASNRMRQRGRGQEPQEQAIGDVGKGLSITGGGAKFGEMMNDPEAQKLIQQKEKLEQKKLLHKLNYSKKLAKKSALPSMLDNLAEAQEIVNNANRMLEDPDFEPPPTIFDELEVRDDEEDAKPDNKGGWREGVRPGAWRGGQASGQRGAKANMLGIGRERQERAANLYTQAAGLVIRDMAGLLLGLMQNTQHETSKTSQATVDAMIAVIEQLRAFLVELWENELAQAGVIAELEDYTERFELPIELIPPATIDPMAFLALDPPNKGG